MSGCMVPTPAYLQKDRNFTVMYPKSMITMTACAFASMYW